MKRYAIYADELYPFMVLEDPKLIPHHSKSIELDEQDAENIDIAYRQFHMWNTFLEEKWIEAKNSQ